MGEDEVNRILRKVIEGRALRDNVTEKGMVLFNKGFLGSAHGITVEQGYFRFPSWSFSKEKASANSPPLSHRRASMIAGTERPAFRRRSLRERKCSAPWAAVLLSRRMPAMKLQDVKWTVMMTLPAIRPTTVSSSTCRSRPWREQ
ncbi:MAG: hypothetical protein ACLR23_27260 [Clostridia bacterium]